MDENNIMEMLNKIINNQDEMKKNQDQMQQEMRKYNERLTLFENDTKNDLNIIKEVMGSNIRRDKR